MASQKPNRVQRVGSYLDIVRDLRLAWQLFWDRRVPAIKKAIPFLALAYVLIPIDLMPDFALGLGQLDDLAIVLLGLKLFVEVAAPNMADQGEVGRDKAAQHSATARAEVIDGTYRLVDRESDARRENLPVSKED